MLTRTLPLVLLLALLAGCSNQLIKPDPALEAQPTPARLAAGSAAPDSTELTWGGLVQSVTNLKHSTELEVLSYPLNTQHRPITSLASTGRFVVRMEGFLEPKEFPVGTAVTAKGPMVGRVQRRIGQATLSLPVLRGDRLKVWQAVAEQSGSKPSVGLGLGLSNYGSGIGVGIGF